MFVSLRPSLLAALLMRGSRLINVKPFAEIYPDEQIRDVVFCQVAMRPTKEFAVIVR